MSFTFSVNFVDAKSGEEVLAPSFEKSFKLIEDHLDNYLDREIADAGVVGGEIWLCRTNATPTVDVVYWHPGAPSRDLVESLQAYTVAQLDDGMGEGGFPFDFGGHPLFAVPNADQPGIVDLTDDSREVPAPPRIAIAARDGNLAVLIATIAAEPDGINRFHQGCTALHLAICYGHVDAVGRLLAADANPNIPDCMGNTPLETCALTNSLDDEQSRIVGQMLLDSQAVPEHHSPEGASARTYALTRGKNRFAEIL